MDKQRFATEGSTERPGPRGPQTWTVMESCHGVLSGFIRRLKTKVKMFSKLEPVFSYFHNFDKSFNVYNSDKSESVFHILTKKMFKLLSDICSQSNIFFFLKEVCFVTENCCLLN